MKKMKIAAGIIGWLAFSQAQADIIVAGWDRATTTPPSIAASITADGIAGTEIFGTGSQGSWGQFREGSDDLTFGSSVTGAVSNSTAGTTGTMRTKTAGDVYLDFVVENSGGATYDLTGFHFDLWRSYPGVAGTYSVSIIAGDLGTASNFATGSITAKGGDPTATADYEDFDISLSSLSDVTLNPGESVTFRLLLTGNNGKAYIHTDNIAVTGTVPEPASLSLFAVSMVGALALRGLGHM